MPEETKTKPAETVKPYVFDKAAFEAKIKKLEAVRDSKVGQPNYNPFVWFNTVVQPLVNSFNIGGKSKDLFDKLLSIPEEVPVIDKDWKEPVVEKFQQLPPGIKLPKR